MKIRIINGYGPQEDEPIVSRLTFWQSLEQEIVAAKNSNCMVLAQMDANAKLGKHVIKHDPHDISENGRLLKSLIKILCVKKNNMNCFFLNVDFFYSFFS